MIGALIALAFLSSIGALITTIAGIVRLVKKGDPRLLFIGLAIWALAAFFFMAADQASASI